MFLFDKLIVIIEENDRLKEDKKRLEKKIERLEESIDKLQVLVLFNTLFIPTLFYLVMNYQ